MFSELSQFNSSFSTLLEDLTIDEKGLSVKRFILNLTNTVRAVKSCSGTFSKFKDNIKPFHGLIQNRVQRASRFRLFFQYMEYIIYGPKHHYSRPYLSAFPLGGKSVGPHRLTINVAIRWWYVVLPVRFAGAAGRNPLCASPRRSPSCHVTPYLASAVILNHPPLNLQTSSLPFPHPPIDPKPTHIPHFVKKQAKK